ncbi:MAG: hypothetical protein JNM20_11300 [Rhizobiales bacterium]|nr:hypothetical protein [Hyphomicrobiales bacterium]
MLTKSALVASAVVAAVAAFLPAQQALAGTQVAVGVGFGTGYGYGYGPGYGYGGYDYPNDYWKAGYGGISCWKGKEIVRWQGFKSVSPYDCSAPVYKYKAWKYGKPYRVRVNWKGYIVSVKPF